MQVKMRVEVSGLRDGAPWPVRGAVIDLPDDEAAVMCGNGMAEPVFDPESGVERAVSPAAEMREALVPTAKRTRNRGDARGGQ